MAIKRVDHDYEGVQCVKCHSSNDECYQVPNCSGNPDTQELLLQIRSLNKQLEDKDNAITRFLNGIEAARVKSFDAARIKSLEERIERRDVLIRRASGVINDAIKRLKEPTFFTNKKAVGALAILNQFFEPNYGKKPIGHKTEFPGMKAYDDLLNGRITLREYGEMNHPTYISTPIYSKDDYEDS